ncbi:unnamed protein product [Xylocopa violacea]|uniref:Secreted protein n=1 Tax=Xylocopa violacea TaxID=135666 RepID=A0ABP1PBU3_XYLVO
MDRLPAAWILPLPNMATRESAVLFFLLLFGRTNPPNSDSSLLHSQLAYDTRRLLCHRATSVTDESIFTFTGITDRNLFRWKRERERERERESQVLLLFGRQANLRAVYGSKQRSLKNDRRGKVYFRGGGKRLVNCFDSATGITRNKRELAFTRTSAICTRTGTDARTEMHTR